MSDHEDLARNLKAKLAELIGRAEFIEDDLRHPLDADSEEQATDLADDEALTGIDEVLRQEISDIRAALVRIDNGTYGTCAKCGGKISKSRLEALPTAALCIECA